MDFCPHESSLTGEVFENRWHEDRTEVKSCIEVHSGHLDLFVVDDLDYQRKCAKYRGGKLRAIVITPTRELAVQIEKHLKDIAKYTEIKIALIIGGMAPQKQERLLDKGPDIVVGTPGRIWDLIELGHPHLSKVSDIRY